MKKLSDLIEALQILATYGDSEVAIHGDMLWVGPDPDGVSALDMDRLFELGFTDSGEDCFYYDA